MSKQETDKMNVKQDSQIEDLPVDNAQQNEVKGGADEILPPFLRNMKDPAA